MDFTSNTSPTNGPIGMALQGNEINRVGLRFPEFTPADPELWFGILDRSFQVAGITADSTKFGYALTAIGPRHTQEVRDIIVSPPALYGYQTLRSELIKRISLSQEHKTRQLLEHEEIRDRKPSQFLRHLRSLAGNVVGNGVLRTIWLSRLPTHVQPHLVTRSSDTIDQLADIADAITEAIRTPSARVMEVASRTPTNAQLNLQIAQMQMQQRELMEQIMNLQKTVQAMQISNRSRDRHRSRSRSRSEPREKRNLLVPLHIRSSSKEMSTTLQCTETGKRIDSPLMAASGEPQASSRLYVIDIEAKQDFLVDTGADLCVYPWKYVRGPRTKSTYELAANGTTIHTYGQQILTLNLGLRRPFIWSFIIADISKPITQPHKRKKSF